MKVVKNKESSSPFRVAEFEMMMARGFSREGGLLDVGVAMDVVTKTGAWFTFGETRLGQGRERPRRSCARTRPSRLTSRPGSGRDGHAAIPVEGIEEAE